MARPVQPPGNLGSSRIMTGVFVNLTATPGLGSLMCRRRSEGFCQLVLSLGGFCLIVIWMVQYFYRMTLEQMGEPLPETNVGWIWKCGIGLFAAGWMWSLFTSISLLREAKKLKLAADQTAPPRLADFPEPPVDQ